MSEKELTYMDNEYRIIKMIEFLFEEVASSGGDGDAFWYTKYFKLEQIHSIIKRINDEKDWPYSIALKEDRIDVIRSHESIEITNSEKRFRTFPSWAQIVIQW
jgi:hypothetical protein